MRDYEEAKRTQDVKHREAQRREQKTQKVVRSVAEKFIKVGNPVHPSGAFEVRPCFTAFPPPRQLMLEQRARSQDLFDKVQRLRVKDDECLKVT
jgi:hypothetical protein